MTPQSLAQSIEDFLAESSHAFVIENGLVTFDLASAKVSISSDNNKCLLHLWSDERNVVRRVESTAHKKDTLRLEVRKFGQAKATTIDICRDRDQRSHSAKRATRAAYQRFIAAVLQREYPGHTVEKMTSAPDLEHSLAPHMFAGSFAKGAPPLRSSE